MRSFNIPILMEKISQEQPTNLNFKCCFLGAIRGKRKNGELMGIVSYVYSHKSEFSHKDFECSFYGSLLIDEELGKDIVFEDPEVWKLSAPPQIFEKREEIIKQYQVENRVVEYCEVRETGLC